MDEFQERYLAHQERKLKDETYSNEYNEYNEDCLYNLTNVMYNRRSQRKFNDEVIKEKNIELIEWAGLTAPTSCNRQAIYLREIEPQFAEKYLVGGARWIDKAQRVYLVFADKNAYKSENEKGFMPYLDAGFVSQNIYLVCEAINLGCCFVNPNIREENKEAFNMLYNEENDYFCGGIALGYYDKKAVAPRKKESLIK